MICTGNYNNFMTHPNGVSISGDRGRSVGYTGASYIKLAPKKIWWDEWEEMKDKVSFYESIIFYIEMYYETVLSKLEPKQVFDELDGKVLLCFEDSKEFCHRHIVAAWLELCLGIEVPEVQVIDNTVVKVSKPAYVKELLSVVIKNHNSNNKILSKQNEQSRPINN